MKPRGFFFLLILTFPLALALAFVFRDTIRQLVLQPILYLFWVINVLLLMVGQQILWFFLILLLIWVLLRNLRPLKTGAYPAAREPVMDTGRGRVSFWAWQVRMISSQAYSKSFSMEELRRLILAVLAFQEQISQKQVVRRLASGELEVPPEVWAVLETGVQPEKFEPLTFWERIRRLYIRLTRRRANRQPKPLTPEVERVIQYLEERLEVTHAGRNF